MAKGTEMVSIDCLWFVLLHANTTQDKLLEGGQL